MLLGQIARAVEFVVGAGDVAEGDAELLLGLVLLALQGVGVLPAKLADELRAIGRPLVVGEVALQVGQRPGLAAVGRQQVELGLLVVAAVGQEGQRPAVGRPARLAVGPFAVGELAQAAAIAIGQPQIGIFLLRLALHALDAEDHLRAVGRDLRVRRQLKQVQVVGSGQPRRGGCVVGHLVNSVWVGCGANDTTIAG